GAGKPTSRVRRGRVERAAYLLDLPDKRVVSVRRGDKRAERRIAVRGDQRHPLARMLDRAIAQIALAERLRRTERSTSTRRRLRRSVGELIHEAQHCSQRFDLKPQWQQLLGWSSTELLLEPFDHLDEHLALSADQLGRIEPGTLREQELEQESVV